jgi:polyferredoxin
MVEFRKLETMKIEVQRVSRWANFAAVIFLATVGAFLSTSPLNPQVGDSHGALMGVFPGALLLLFALLLYFTGLFLNRQKKWGWLVQLPVSVVAILALIIQALE